MNAVEIKNLTKNFNAAAALYNITTNIKKGRITGLIGADGAGKTTLLRIIAGLMFPNNGDVTVLGINPARKKDESSNRMG